MTTLCGLLTYAGSSLALTINSGATDVGIKDTKIAETTKLDGEAAEFTWVKSILGNDIVFVEKHDSLTAFDWSQTNESGTWAYYLSDSPDYFLVKTGNNKTNSFVDYLFNNSNTSFWAVLDLDDIYVASVTNIGKVSHLTDYNNPSPVPEPGTMVLLGAGMLGLAIFGKRRMNKE